MYETNKGGRKKKRLSDNQPPKKKRIKWIDDIIKCRYSARKNISSIGPLYSVAYPDTTSDSVSAWSNGALFDSKNRTTINDDEMGANITIYQYEYWCKTKSWKLVEFDNITSIEYNTVIKISKEMTCTNDLTVPRIAYRDWLSIPTMEKNIFATTINIIW